MYTIVDIETTGNGIKGNKITEISIFKYDGEQVVDEFTSLVNPECEIPYFITGLTGIDNFMVRNAPTIEEIAPKILEITEGCVFIAHSVNFDYNVIKNELREIGITFVRKKLCTVRLSRRVFPGIASYSLGKLCAALDISITDRHRARGDALATVTLFRKVLGQPNSEEIIKSFLNARSQEATLPPTLDRETYEQLPSSPGIYFFKDQKGRIIYVGKAKNIKKRVLGHFYDKSDKEVRMCRETHTIDFKLSGSEILALLMESAAIKHHYPLYNRAQKTRSSQTAIFSYQDRKGVLHLAYNKRRNVPNPLMVLNNTTEARLFLEQLCLDFELCPKYCHLQEQVAQCSHFRIANCKGICRGKEAVIDYNSRVLEAIETVKSRRENVLIKEKGRHSTEEAVILIQEGCYRGYGFIDKELGLHSLEDLLAHIIPQKHTMEAQQLISSYLIKNPQKASYQLNHQS